MFMSLWLVARSVSSGVTGKEPYTGERRRGG